MLAALAAAAALATAVAPPTPVAPPAATATAPAGVPPVPSRWVEDHAGLMSPPSRAALDARLESYERATGHQIVVWIGGTIGGAALDDWAVHTFASWKVGRAGLDDGVALFVLAGDRKIDIEVGYGLEDKLPDAIASRIIRETMAPRLRSGDADGAITAGASAVLAAIEGHPWNAGVVTATQPSTATSASTWIVGGIAVLAMLILFATHPRSLWWLLWLMARSAGGGGGGRSSGFGGGGGRSGGGGARGGW